MEITAETVQAYRAVRRLQELYDAYRATSRANVLVVSRLIDAMADVREVPADKRDRDRVIATAKVALSRQSEAVYALRRAQLGRRRLELLGLEELP